MGEPWMPSCQGQGQRAVSWDLPYLTPRPATCEGCCGFTTQGGPLPQWAGRRVGRLKTQSLRCESTLFLGLGLGGAGQRAHFIGGETEAPRIGPCIQQALIQCTKKDLNS